MRVEAQATDRADPLRVKQRRLRAHHASVLAARRPELHHLLHHGISVLGSSHVRLY